MLNSFKDKYESITSSKGIEYGRPIRKQSRSFNILRFRNGYVQPSTFYWYLVSFSWVSFAIAIRAVDRSARARFKRYLGIFPTCGAFRREHLPRGCPVASVSGNTAITTTSGCVRLSGCTACRAALRIIGIAPGSILFLLTGTEGEGSSTVRTGNLFVAITHGDDLLFG
jgi:hypothetical protein